ncbi:MAG: c-type cytochrome [Aquincola sp.]|nr:c-type cytochrome [Aquincola sp.]MDH4288956.1 c-type cytochrome [Aquincola sp.]MDH5331268.1 c-type cytochrome [Aquincola sp.]
MWRDAAVGTALAALVFLVGWDLAAPGAATATATHPSEDAHELGRRIYNFRCYFCHGYSGDAKTLAASYLQPPPRDFTRSSTLTRGQIAAALREGRPGTAMASFANVLAAGEMEAVAAFVEREFVQQQALNTRYHTEANGWPAHERHAAAFPFARGEIALDAPDEMLDAGQRAGRRLFLATCVSCHDRGRVNDAGPAWSARPISYPRMGFAPGQPNTPPVDAVSSASVYAKHEVPPTIDGLTARERRGEALFQANCAFCHGADGTGKNWIGQFMEPKARDLTAYTVAQMTAARLKRVIREGLPGTSMPAWQHVLAPREIDAIVAYVSRAMLRTEPATVSLQ